jgi:Trypsin-like peptidase domain
MAWDPSESLQQLRAAVDTLNRPRVAELSTELIERLRTTDDSPYPERGAADILSLLRRKRHFTLLQQVADAFIQAGVDRPVVRRQYAQALLDQGNLTAGVTVLERLVAETTDQPRENFEARGLLGRAYKQMYLATGPGAPARRQLFMERAVAAYYDVYVESQNLWHGINAAALLTRAARDRIAPRNVADPESTAMNLAAEILERIEAKGDGADAWDRGTAVEACVALGRTEEAVGWLDSYLQATGTDAFELASTHRQLTEVWRLDPDADPGARLLPLLRATLLRRQGGEELLVGPADVATQTLRRIDRQAGFERNFSGERFNSLIWFRSALERCRGVARIEDPLQSGVGTGFLVAGASLHPSFPDRVLVTNAHVVCADDPEALDPEQAHVTFRAIERADGPSGTYRIAKVLWCSLRHQLDVTIAVLDGYPEEAIPCPVAAHRPRMDSDPAPQTYIIGHPSGAEQVMFSIRDNLLLDADETRVHYRTPTLEGSSGSPVFNAMWQLIALHHLGLTHMPKLHGEAGTYAANEGIWIDRIKAELQTAMG